MPIIDLVDEVDSAVGISWNEKTNMHVVIHKDNANDLVLAQTLPPQYTPRSKDYHYDVKTHWFCEACIARNIVLQKKIHNRANWRHLYKMSTSSNF